MKTASTTDLILAIDLGKYKSVACLYQPTTAEVLLSGWVHDLCVRHGVKCLVASTSSEAWKFKHTKRKTDQDDALRLASLCALGQLPTVTVPSPA